MPAFIDQTMALLGNAAIPLSLVALGMGLAGFGLAAGWRESAAMACMKLVVHPLAVYAAARLLRLAAARDRGDRDARRIAGRRQRVPYVAPVRLLTGPVASAIVVTTAAAAATTPIVLDVRGRTGLTRGARSRRMRGMRAETGPWREPS